MQPFTEWEVQPGGHHDFGGQGTEVFLFQTLFHKTVPAPEKNWNTYNYIRPTILSQKSINAVGMKVYVAAFSGCAYWKNTSTHFLRHFFGIKIVHLM